VTTAIEVRRRLTPEDLLAMPDHDRYELVDGELKERDMGAESNFVANNINGEVRAYGHGRKLGLAFGEGCGIRIFPEPNPLRVADGAFVARGRLAGDRPPAEGYLMLAPDLVVEVVSPNDMAAEIERKVADYLVAGVRLVWVAYPATRHIHVFRPDGSLTLLDAESVLDGGDVLSGFQVPVAGLFPEPAVAVQS
jgi:Uma2 family endonuclease